MSVRPLHFSFLFGAFILLGGALTFSADSIPERRDKRIEDFTLSAPLDKSRVSLGDFKDKKALVVLFVGTECPINNAYLPVLAQLYKDYADKGIGFLAI